MKNKMAAATGLAIQLLTAQSFAGGESAYHNEFVREVHEFASHNRIQQSRLHRDVHADCYIRVIATATILADGTLKSVSIDTSSTVPIVDKYFAYAIKQAAPYKPIAEYYRPAPDEVSITHEFTLDARVYNDNRRSRKPCDELQKD